MRQCPHDGCGWQAISASATGADRQFARHLLDEHARRVEADIPEGMVQVRTGENEEWQTMTLEDAKVVHRTLGDGSGNAEF